MIELENLRKRYGDFQLDVTMKVEPGRVTGLIGKNGSGKSTTFKAILGLLRADSGKAETLGRTAARLRAKDRQKIGVVLAESGFSSSLCVKDVTAVMKRMYRDFDEKAFLQQCRKHELPEEKRIGEFSSGMKAKLKALVAMSHKADLLVLDEPTVGLDVMARNELLDILRSYMEEDEKRSILISSHISSDLEGLCDDLYLIDGGRIVLHEDTDVLLADYAVLKVDNAQYESLDKQYLLRRKKESFGYRCLTGEKQFYLENYPELVIEKGGIDDVMVMMIGGEQI